MDLAILIPSRGYISSRAFVSLLQACSFTERWWEKNFPGGTVKTMVLTRSQIALGRTLLARAALQQKCDWCLWLDDDAIVPSDVVPRLFAHQKDMAAPWVLTRGENGRPMACHLERFEEAGQQKMRKVQMWERPEGLTKIGMTAFHCVLMRSAVLQGLFQSLQGKSPFEYLVNRVEDNIGEDYYFFQLAYHHGFELWLDPSVRVGHLGEQIWGEVA